jgi:hypothetical protein
MGNYLQPSQLNPPLPGAWGLEANRKEGKIARAMLGSLETLLVIHVTARPSDSQRSCWTSHEYAWTSVDGRWLQAIKWRGGS